MLPDCEENFGKMFLYSLIKNIERFSKSNQVLLPLFHWLIFLSCRNLENHVDSFKNGLSSFSFVCFYQLFWLSQGQLWATVENVASFSWCLLVIALEDHEDQPNKVDPKPRQAQQWYLNQELVHAATISAPSWSVCAYIFICNIRGALGFRWTDFVKI